MRKLLLTAIGCLFLLLGKSQSFPNDISLVYPINTLDTIVQPDKINLTTWVELTDNELHVFTEWEEMRLHLSLDSIVLYAIESDIVQTTRFRKRDIYGISDGKIKLIDTQMGTLTYDEVPKTIIEFKERWIFEPYKY